MEGHKVQFIAPAGQTTVYYGTREKKTHFPNYKSKINVFPMSHTIFFLLSKYESVKIYWSSVKFDWFK